MRWLSGALALCLGLLLQHPALAFTLTVVDGQGNAVTDFRWMLEEDNTAPGQPGFARNDTVSMIIHKSHAPVAATGTSPDPVKIKGPSGALLDPESTGKRYLLSILADGYSPGGAPLTNGQSTVQVILNAHYLPTAQINILAFNDNNPINNVPDAGEAGIPGCQVILHDFLGGPMLTDTFGNPLGTTYKFWTASYGGDVNMGDVAFPNVAEGDIDWNGNGIFDSAPNGDPLMTNGAPVIDKLGSGQIYTDANGKALIKYLAMGKYGVQVIPPSGSVWSGGHASTPDVKGSYNQTATIEGTLTVDAWVKPNEPQIFMEGFGPGNYHVFFGFVAPNQLEWATNAPSNGVRVTLHGTNRFNHFGRPSTVQPVAVGPAVSEAWVGLNAMAGGLAGAGLYATPCDPNTGEFTIPNVPVGLDYQLVFWDIPLDALFTTHVVPVPANLANNSTYEVGEKLSSRWFGTYEGSVFYDANANGFRDPSEVGMAQQTLNLRWRDGTIYQGQATDAAGDFAFTEVFPFFKWLIAEVGFERFKPTGMTTVVDEGGVIPADAGWAMPSEGVRTPQAQFEVNLDGTQNTGAPILNPNTGNNLSRTELSTDPAAPLLLEANMLFLNQNNRIDWGKINYGTTPDGRPENGGIAGVVGYGATRAEEDPRMGVIDPWESGIPRVQMVLYQDANGDKVIDDLDGNGVTLADIDNYPLGWNDGSEPKGPEDVDRNGNGTFDPGDAIQIAWTDSWDDSPPTGSQQTNPPVILSKPIIGSDNYSTWNQVREGVFDGGYAFGSYHPGGIASGSPETKYLPQGMYIVQSCPPPGYLILTEESFNVTFGDAYKPSKLLLPPELVGTQTNHWADTNLVNMLPENRKNNPATTNLFIVPDELSLFPGTPCAFAGQERPIADMKWVRVATGKNAAADFHVYTEVPKASRVVGFVLNDLTAEFNSQNPIFGEKGAPSWLPISFRDWAGHEVARTYSDEYGSYEALLPSSISAAIPMPSGFAPNMLTLILNDPTMPDPAHPGNRIPDPNYNPAYATTPWTLHYYPATFLYADTPIVPVASFVGGPNTLLDVEPPANTPVITNVTVGPVAAPTVPGPYVPASGGIVNIYSLGTVLVPNPKYINGSATEEATILRHFGFGSHTSGDGAVVTIAGVPVPEGDIVSWDDASIRVHVENTLAEGASGQIMVKLASGLTTQIGVTLTRGSAGDVLDLTGVGNGNVHVVNPVDPVIFPRATPIQNAIDAAHPGDLVIVPVAPSDYNENPILWKPLRLQGSGLGTVINATPVPAERLTDWHAKVATILTGNATSSDPFAATESPGIMVIGSGVGTYAADFTSAESRIDGFQIKGGVAGGGISVWNEASNLRISNNRVIGNQGSVCGGISIGEQAQAGVLYNNPNVLIEYNQILQNGGVGGAGGIGIFTGATGYKIQNNYIMGNFTRGSGGGIGHEGRSPGGLIANNVIAYNEVFYGTPAPNIPFSGDGGGIFISGLVAPGAGLSDGAGSVTIINNLIQGNLAGAGNGGGIAALGVNGADVAAAPGAANAGNWYALDIFNNIIVNNLAGLAGGGISLADATRVRIINNTIAHNDSSATAQAAFASDVSSPQGAGLVSYSYSAALVGADSSLTGGFCNPVLQNNIIWQNRSFVYTKSTSTLTPAAGIYSDLKVADNAAATLNPQNCFLTINGDPLFASSYFNELATAVVADETGNNISVRLSPISIFTPEGTNQGNYHIVSSSPAIDVGVSVASIPELDNDFDGNNRAAGIPDIGADEFGTALSIIPPTAPAITVVQSGPAATGTAPPATGTVTGPGVPPGAPMAPLYLNPLPGDPLNPLLDKDPLVDSDGDGIPDNDVDYFNLTAGDGWATMADGTDLYTFGFSDQTAIVATETAKATAAYRADLAGTGLAAELAAKANGPLANGGNSSGQRNGQGNALISIRDLHFVTSSDTLVWGPLNSIITLLKSNGSTDADGIVARDRLLALAAAITAEVDGYLRGIGPTILTEGLLSANIAAPTMVFHEGRDAYLDLSNVGMLMRPDLFDPHTVHFHGFAQAASIFDGEPMASISIAMGGTLRYYYKIQDPGTYLYHCHVEATEHMQMGMIGNLYVLPKQNNLPDGTVLGSWVHHTGNKYAYNDGDGSTRYDVEAPLQVTGFDRNFHEQHIAVQPLPFAAMVDDYPMLNGRGYPDTINPNPLPPSPENAYERVAQKVTSLVTATAGQRILLRLSNVSETDIQTLTVLGLPMRVVAKDARLLRGPTGKSLAYNTSSVKLGGGETTDVILDTTGAAPGTYLLYATRLNHLSNDTQDYGGLMTEIVIE